MQQPQGLLELQELFQTYSAKRLLELKEVVENGTANRREILEFRKLVSFENIRTFTNFVRAMNYDIDYQWFHWLLMSVLDDIIVSPRSRRLMVELPPRHCKTLLAGILLCAYLFGRFKDKNTIYATANNEKAVSELTNMRSVITSDRYQQIFPGAKAKSSLDDDNELDKRTRKTKKDTANILSNVYSDRGSIRTAGMGDMLSGYPGHFLIADDLYKGHAEAQSDKIRETIWHWFWSVFMTRADKIERKDGIIEPAHAIVFFTRWHDDDVCGRIQRLQNENRAEIEQLESAGIPWIDWEVFSFEAVKTGTKSSHPLDKRLPGEPLWKKYEDIYHSQRIMNPLKFEAIYQANPINNIGKLFEKHYFQEYQTLPEAISRIVIGIDPNLKETKSSDSFAIVVLGLSGQKVFLLDFVAKARNYETLKIETMHMLRKYPYYWAVIVEQTANGPALTSDLKKTFSRIVEFKPGSNSKFERASLILPVLASGNYFIPSRNIKPDIEFFVNQHTSFTGEKGRHDDLVDANVIALMFYMQNKCVSNISQIRTMQASPVKQIVSSNSKFALSGILPSSRKSHRRRDY